MTLIYPYLNYCNIIWGGADKTNIDPLLILQKKAIRIISRVAYLEHTDPLYTSLNLLKVPQLYDLNCLLFIYKCQFSGRLNEFKNKMIRNSEYHNYNTRNQSDFRLPKTRLKKIRQSFLFVGIDLWNKLSQSTIIYKSSLKFKSNLRNFKRNIKKKMISNVLNCQSNPYGATILEYIQSSDFYLIFYAILLLFQINLKYYTINTLINSYM